MYLKCFIGVLHFKKKDERDALDVGAIRLMSKLVKAKLLLIVLKVLLYDVSVLRIYLLICLLYIFLEGQLTSWLVWEWRLIFILNNTYLKKLFSCFGKNKHYVLSFSNTR